MCDLGLWGVHQKGYHQQHNRPTPEQKGHHQKSYTSKQKGHPRKTRDVSGEMASPANIRGESKKASPGKLDMTQKSSLENTWRQSRKDITRKHVTSEQKGHPQQTRDNRAERTSLENSCRQSRKSIPSKHVTSEQKGHPQQTRDVRAESVSPANTWRQSRRGIRVTSEHQAGVNQTMLV